MALEQLYVFVCQLLAVHILETVAEYAAVHTDEALFRKLAHKGGNVLVLDIGVCVELAACGRIG